MFQTFSTSRKNAIFGRPVSPSMFRIILRSWKTKQKKTCNTVCEVTKFHKVEGFCSEQKYRQKWSYIYVIISELKKTKQTFSLNVNSWCVFANRNRSLSNAGKWCYLKQKRYVTVTMWENIKIYSKRNSNQANVYFS